MKNVILKLLFYSLLLTPFVLLAQDEDPVEPMSKMTAFIQILGAFFGGVLIYLLQEAGKHIFGGTFSPGIFYDTNIKPILWSIVGAIVAAALWVFLPQTLPFIETQTGESVDVTSWTGLLVIGSAIGAAIKGIIARPVKA